MSACNTLTVDQLLSLRDGAPVAAIVKLHVDECADCARELGRLTALRTAMRAMPTLTPPAFDAAALRARQHASSAQRLPLIAAALGALTLTLIVATHDRAPPPMATAAVQEVAAATDVAPPVEAWVIRSQELESLLQRLPQRPTIERASTSTTIDSLQSRIQWVDYQLSLANEAGLTEADSAQLWRKRVELMDSLVKVRYAEAERTAYVTVSALH